MSFSFFKSLFSKKEKKPPTDKIKYVKKKKKGNIEYVTPKETPFISASTGIKCFFIEAKRARDVMAQATTFWALLHDLNNTISWIKVLIKRLDNEEDKAYARKYLQKLTSFSGLAYSIREYDIRRLEFFEPTQEQIKIAKESMEALEELRKFFKAKGLLEMPPPKKPIHWREKIIRGNSPPAKNPHKSSKNKDKK